MNIKQIYSLLVLYSVLAHIASAESPKAILLDEVIANVDSHIILQSELETAYQQYLLQGGEESPSQKCEILEQLIVNKAILSKAIQEGVVAEEEAVEELFSDRMRYFLAQIGSEEKLVQYWGKPIAGIKSEIREKIKERLILDKMRAKIIRDVSVTPKEVKEFFEALPFEEQPYYPTQVSVRQIVQYPQINQQEKYTQLAQLNALKVRIQNGEDFEALAREYSQDPNSAPLGGDLGFCHLGELAPPYEVAALALQPGEVSDPVITPLGFHLIQLIAQEKNRYSSRHILLKSSTGILDTGAIKIQLARLRTAILAGKITFEQAARKFSEDPLSASNGGLLTGEYGGTRMSIDALSPDLYFSIEHLVPGAISDPIPFTSADGREAVRLLLLEEKIAPHQANLAQDYAKIRQMLINQREATVLQKWVERLRAEVSIRVAPNYQHCSSLK